jgi:hypothetical protein
MTTVSPDDVFADWRNKKFVVTDKQIFEIEEGHLIILIDYVFWEDHMGELEDWCQCNGGKIQGMTLTLPTDQVLSAFLLRWA